MKKLVALLIVSLIVPLLSASPNMAWRQVIPAAASTAGSDNAYWRTDLVVYNPSDTAATLTVELIPSGEAGAMGTRETVALPEALAPLATVTVTDVLGNLFPDHATGALVVVARAADGAQVEVVASTRTWTPTATGDSSFGQGIPGVPWREDGDLVESKRLLAGLEASESFRTNLGLVNLTETVEEVFSVEIFNSAGASQGVKYYTLGPSAHFQKNDILGRFGVEGGGFTAEVKLVSFTDLAPKDGDSTDSPDFVAYASRIDRRTNDPFYIGEQTDVRRTGIYRHQLVPVVASKEGEESSYWRTDLTIHHPGDTPSMIVWVKLLPSWDVVVDGPMPEFFTFMQPGATITIEDVLAARFSGHEAAALLVYTKNGLDNLIVTSRTWTPATEGEGSLGQGIPGIHLAVADQPLVLTGLESNEAFRSNIGLVNRSMNLREFFEVEIFDAAGMSQGVLSYTMEPWSHRQINGVLEDLQLEGTGFTAVVTMVDSENLFVASSESWDPYFTAYGSVVDSITNDPTYLEGVGMQPPREQVGDWYDFELEAPWYLCPEQAIPAEATVVRAFDQAYHYFGAENHRSITQEVVFPDSADWNQVGLYFQLECPASGDCDDWDRSASLQMLLNPEAPQEEWEYLEIIRHITPYKIETCEYVDLTPLAPMLTGSRTLVSWIDTWVGPGHAQGEGWRVTFDFVFYPGEARQADEVINIWGRRNITVGFTEPDNNVDSQIDPVTVAIPADATRVEARLITTGHSWGSNTDNCAEFCPLRQDLYVNDQLTSVLPWRTDCEHNPNSPQSGTWQFDRNGWCPGAIVVGQGIDISGLVTPGADNIIDFDIRKMDGEEYVNSTPEDWAPNEWVSLKLYVWTD